jgi:hypothetical protein
VVDIPKAYTSAIMVTYTVDPQFGSILFRVRRYLKRNNNKSITALKEAPLVLDHKSKQSALVLRGRTKPQDICGLFLPAFNASFALRDLSQSLHNALNLASSLAFTGVFVPSLVWFERR